MSIFYLDPVSGIDDTVASPLGWWSLAIIAGTGGAPVADEACSGATAHGHLTVYVHTSGSWAGNDEAGTLYLYGKSGTFGAETVSWAAGNGTVAGDATYCAWKTIAGGALAARTASGDTVRIGKTSVPVSIGTATWTKNSKTVTLDAAQTANIYMCETTAFTGKTGMITVLNATPTAGGSGYAVNDTFNITTGGTGATGKVTTVAGTVVTGVQLTSGGSGYTTGAGKATVHTSGGGNDALTVNITTIGTISSAYYTTNRKEGAGMVSITEPANTPVNTKLAYYNLGGALNLSGYQKISLWWYNGAIVNEKKICLCSDTSGDTVVDTFLVPTLPSASYVPLTLTKVGGGNLGANINSIAIYSDTVVAGAYTFYLDDIIACTSTGLSLTALISKNSLDQGGAEPWLGIKSINGTTVELDNHNANTNANGRGYSGATAASVNTYIRYGITGGAGTIQESNVSYIGGYDPITNLCDGETFFDGQSGAADGLYINGKTGIYVSRISCVRCSYGIRMAGASGGNTFDQIQSLNNNANQGFYSNPSEMYNTITNLMNACNNGTGGVSFSTSAGGGYMIPMYTVVDIGNASGNLGNGITIVTYSGLIITGGIANACNNSGVGVRLGGTSGSMSGIEINSIVHADYNAGQGLSIGWSNSNKIYAVSAEYNTSFGVLFDVESYDNRIYDLVTSNNSPNKGIGLNIGRNYVINASIAEATKVGDGGTSSADSVVYFQRYGGDPAVNLADGPLLSYDTVATTRPGGTGIMWQFSSGTYRNTAYSAQCLPVGRFLVAGSGKVTVKIWMKATHTYVRGFLLCRRKQIPWSDPDADIVTNNPVDTNWNQLTLEFTPTEAGVVEIEVGAYQTSGGSFYLNIDDLTISQA